MDEHRIYNVISYWHDSAGNHGQFRASMATTAIVTDHSCIFARLLLLVSSRYFFVVLAVHSLCPISIVQLHERITTVVVEQRSRRESL